MTFNHLSFEERIKIEDYLEQGLSQAQIASKLGRSRSTICRELKRNMPEYNPLGISNFRYLGSSADNVARLRRMEIGLTSKLTDYNKKIVEKYLRLKWSPEQIANGLKHKLNISTNTIYNWIYSNKLDFKLKDLRLHGKRYKQHHKGRLIPRKESQMMKAHSIEKRPEIINKRAEFGHWEVYTVLSSRKSNDCLATFVERKTRRYFAIKIKNRTADQFSLAMDTFMANFTGSVKSITCDHGSEFSSHSLVYRIEHTYGVKVFFAHPYSPHERGCNEHHNRLLREYFPKKTSFRNVSPSKILQAVFEINERPRKTLNWKSANFKFESEQNKVSLS
ncbi:IS30 family transposase [Fructilactobacillus vespulae]|uniref:IS30 family transposase n=1 Tax=Fructilactobacillus vespulae TaxID=1249630 RepID=UPI0039B48E7F